MSYSKNTNKQFFPDKGQSPHSLQSTLTFKKYLLKNLLHGGIDTNEALILLIPMCTIKEMWRFWIGSGSILTPVSTRRHISKTFQNILAHRFSSMTGNMQTFQSALLCVYM